MDLVIKDIANLLMTSENEILQLIKKDEIPYQLLNDKYFFNKQKIIEWALNKNIPLNLTKHKKFSEFHIESLVKILDKDSFYYNCKLDEKNYIEQMIFKLNLDKSVDKEIIISLLKSRESLMSTSIGNGISLPHPRVPIVIGKNKPLINIFFPEHQLHLNSLDGKPVHTIILLISQTIKQHLSLIAHISFLLSKETFRFALENRLDYKEIIDIIKRIELTRNN
ncbi:MAG: PTS sugar transporter subunit IIA [Stygiobacter sp.]